MDSKIESIIAQMTLDEKAALCTGASFWTTVPVERLGVPEMTMSDGPHGVRRVSDVNQIGGESLPATCFPTASSLAATWDTDLLFQVGQALGEEAAAQNVDVLLGPGVNMKRTPLCGRNFEYFSEDPFLAGTLSVGYINGVQSKGVGVSLKHFAVNNQEFKRMSIDAEVDERTLREIYLPAFEMAVKQAKPWMVMCAYNKLNGTLCSEHEELLTDILKDEWGFDGLVVSDWGAVWDRAAGVSSGLDLEMPGPRMDRTQQVAAAVKAGTLAEAALDETVRRILRIVFKARETPKGQTAFDAAAHHALARRVSAEGMVLLKNNGLLPLKADQNLAVIGRAAQTPHYQGGGSSHINPTQVDRPFIELQKLAGNAELSFAEGYPADTSFQLALINEAVELAAAADTAILYIALPTFKESEGGDRTDLDLTEQQIKLIQAVSAAQPNTVVVLNNGSAVAMDAWIDGPAAVIESWLMGQAGGGAVADVLFGVVNPSGKLTETFPHRLEDTPAFPYFPEDFGKARYGEGQFIGYRHYDKRKIPVLFPFGYGLSYTTFEYSHPKVATRKFKDVDGVEVSVDVTNTGDYAGKEVVQIYVHDHQATLPRPYKELKGFAKVALEPGETKTVSVHLDQRAFAFYHPGHGEWVTESGEFDILIGSSASDIRFSETVTLESTQQLASLLKMDSTVGEWLQDPMGMKVIKPFYDMLTTAFGAELDEGLGMDMSAFIFSTPLVSLLGFQANALPMPPEAIVQGMLAQVYGITPLNE